MKIIVFSDSHGYAGHMLTAIQKEAPDLVIHLGDGSSDTQAIYGKYPDLELINIRGNCDQFSTDPLKKVITVENKWILAVHGHEYGVRENDCTNLRNAAFNMLPELSIVLFGHTHVPFYEYRMSMHFLNPGTCQENATNPTYGLIHLTDGKIHTEIKNCNASANR